MSTMTFSPDLEMRYDLAFLFKAMNGSRKYTKYINLLSIKINSSAYHDYRRLATWKKTALVKVTFLLMSQPSLTSLTITQNLAAPVEESLPQLRLQRPLR